VLEALTTESFGAAAVVALRAEHTKVPAQGGEARLDLATYFQAMRERLIAAEKVEEAELLQLAGDRASAIRGYLIEVQQIPSERVETIENETQEEAGQWVRCRLSLEGSD
jgi:hypothetical protein